MQEAARLDDDTRTTTPNRAVSPRQWVARLLILVLLCCAVGFSVGLMTGDDPGEARARVSNDPLRNYYPSQMPRYPGAVELPQGERNAVGGSAVRMSYFTTEDSVDKVASFYQRHFETLNYFVRKETTHVGGLVSAFDAVQNRAFQVILARREDLTHVFPSLTEAPQQAMATDAQPPPLELYPGSHTIIAYSSRERTAEARIHVSQNSASLGENEMHYKGALSQAGYQPELSTPPALAAGLRVLVYRRGDRELTVNLAAVGERATRVHITLVSAR